MIQHKFFAKVNNIFDICKLFYFQECVITVTKPIFSLSIT